MDPRAPTAGRDYALGMPLASPRFRTSVFLVALVVQAGCAESEPAPGSEVGAGGSGGQGGAAPVATPSDPRPEPTAMGGAVGAAGTPALPTGPSVPSGGAGSSVGGAGAAGGAGGTPGGGGASGGMPAVAGGGASAAGAGQGGADPGTDPCAIPDEYEAPTLLSQTGLYLDTSAGTLAEGVRPYQPRFELWSDGAAKQRWVYVPPCGPIDTSDPDYWNYPVGFKLWKQFDRENAAGELVRVETRMIHKYSATKWFMTAYVWNEDQSDAAISEADGPAAFISVENAKGTDHDVPGQRGCEGCHFNMLDKALGFTALQLDQADVPEGFVTLATLEAEGVLSDPIARPITVPGTPEQAAALGYIHANCGHCHNPYSKQAGLSMQLWLQLGALDSLEASDIYLSTVGVMNQAPQQPVAQPPVRVVPGSPEESAMYWRMVQPPVYPASPEGGDHMPLIGTEITHEEGVQLVADWIRSLSPTP